jgi:hypothetical protein
MLTQTRVRELFEYDPLVGDLVRRVRTRNQVPGKIAGSVNAHGHINVGVDGRLYAAHRIVFLWWHGWLPKEIDHRNRIKTDNRIDNLRASTSSQNKGNIGLLVNNTSGFRGVSFNTRRQKWHAQIKINGKQTYLGGFDLPEQAARVYNAAAVKHFGEFAHLNDV